MSYFGSRCYYIFMNCTKEQSAEIVEKYWQREWDMIKSIDFPPIREKPITLTACEREWAALQSTDGLSVKSNSRIVKYFHPSLNKANKGHMDSPYNYWQRLRNDPELFKKFYENRIRCSDWFKEKDGAHMSDLWEGKVPLFIYGIGLTTSQKAPTVSYFKPGFAKTLVKRYLDNYSTIVDTFSGYSGRLLGAAASGKNYIGFDINDLTVQESNEIIKFLNSPLNLSVRCSDSLKEKGDYRDCGYLSCPPYGDIEEWVNCNGERISCNLSCDEIIEYTLDNYKCAKYVFIVDDSSTKYDNYIVDYIVNDSYINARNGGKPGQNKEKIIVVE